MTARTMITVLALVLVGCTNILGDFSEGLPLAAAADGGGDSRGAADVAPPGDDAGTPVETDAAPEAAPASCITDLSNVGAGDFQIAFTLTTSWSGPPGSTMALVSQRAGGSCDSFSSFWEVTLSSLGGIIASTDDGDASSYVTAEQSSAPVNDGKPHPIVVARTGGRLWIATDGALNSTPGADAYSFGTFAPLTLGSSSCATTALMGHGSLADLCVTRRP